MKQKLLFSAAAFALTLSATNARVGVMTEAAATVADNVQRTAVALEKLATAEGDVALKAEGDGNVLTALFSANEQAVKEAFGKDVDFGSAEGVKKALKTHAIVARLAKMAAKSSDDKVQAAVELLATKETDAEKPKPDEEKPKPDEEKPKPDEEKPKPDEEKPKPDEEKPKPDEEKPKPDEEKPKPDEEKPKPDGAAKAAARKAKMNAALAAEKAKPGYRPIDDGAAKAAAGEATKNATARKARINAALIAAGLPELP